MKIEVEECPRFQAGCICTRCGNVGYWMERADDAFLDMDDMRALMERRAAMDNAEEGSRP